MFTMEQITMLKLSLMLGMIGFVLYQIFNKPKNKVQQEINKILTDDAYKVKGQYE